MIHYINICVLVCYIYFSLLCMCVIVTYALEYLRQRYFITNSVFML